jgi:hypothetical protein
MRWQVMMSGHVSEWLDSIDEPSRKQIGYAIEALAVGGPNLGRPIVDTISGSTYKNMKELRPGSSGKSEIRILFAFDPIRQAYLILAGDKSGEWTKWYKKNLPLAEKIYAEHLEELNKK